jgi:hypothetical protein
MGSQVTLSTITGWLRERPLDLERFLDYLVWTRASLARSHPFWTLVSDPLSRETLGAYADRTSGRRTYKDDENWLAGFRAGGRAILEPMCERLAGVMDLDWVLEFVVKCNADKPDDHPVWGLVYDKTYGKTLGDYALRMGIKP